MKLIDKWLRRGHSEKTKPEKPRRKPLSAKEVERVEAALQNWVAKRRYREMLTPADSALEMNVTKAQLYTYFATREDFRTWRTKLRIEDAKALLLEETGLSAKQVGETVGFSDRSNFSRQFLKHVGCTPRQWRAAHENGY